MNLSKEFNRRFGNSGKMPETVSTPASITLFGSCGISFLPVISLSLSFGTECAYRKRTDDRIILCNTSSDTTECARISQLRVFTGTETAKNIFRSITALTQNPTGAELLLHTECKLSDFSSERLCALFAYSYISQKNESIRSIVKLSEAYPTGIVSLIPNCRFAAINPLTLDYISYSFSFKGYKLVCACINDKVKFAYTDSYLDRERERINSAVQAISANDITSLGRIMTNSGKDLISFNQNNPIKELFCAVTVVADFARPLDDLPGVIAIVADGKCDELIKVASLKYQKKTGVKPVFYISD